MAAFTLAAALKPASPMLQQGTALGCWRDVYSNESSGWEEGMLSGVRVAAVLSEAQPVQ